jgi:hypothetical protein
LAGGAELYLIWRKSAEIKIAGHRKMVRREPFINAAVRLTAAE